MSPPFCCSTPACPPPSSPPPLPPLPFFHSDSGLSRPHTHTHGHTLKALRGRSSELLPRCGPVRRGTMWVWYFLLGSGSGSGSGSVGESLHVRLHPLFLWVSSGSAITAVVVVFEQCSVIAAVAFLLQTHFIMWKLITFVTLSNGLVKPAWMCTRCSLPGICFPFKRFVMWTRESLWFTGWTQELVCAE